MTEVSLDDVVLSEEAVTAYRAFAKRFARTIVGLGINADDIPDEQARVEDGGSLTVLVELPQGRGEVSMTIPSGHWRWARRQ